MRLVTILDTSISSDNLGDEIIMDAVYDVLGNVLPNAFFYKVATHDVMGRWSSELLRKSDLAIVGGTNILDPHMPSQNGLWKLRRFDGNAIRPILLLGVGYRSYSYGFTPKTVKFLRKVLDQKLTHSVRDSYTLEKLRGVVPNVANTACMSMWKLTPEWCLSIPKTKANGVVTTLTYYARDPIADRHMLEILASRYATVHFWPQQAEDVAYFDSLGVQKVRKIAPTTSAYTHFLETAEVDFIGTRLHGGIRALQRGRRTLIIGIDNRATEISRDTNLPVLERKKISMLEEWIDGRLATEIRLPAKAIDAWKLQFSEMS